MAIGLTQQTDMYTRTHVKTVVDGSTMNDIDGNRWHGSF